MRNVRMTVAESLEALKRVVAIGAAHSTPADAVISCCFGSPYESGLRPAAADQREIARAVSLLLAP